MLHIQMSNRPECHLLNTYFMPKLMGLTGSAEDKYRQVARWTRGINLAEKVATVAPVFNDDHWFLLVATDMSGSHPTVTVLNSIPGYGNEEQAATAFIEFLRVVCKVSTIRLLRPQLPKQSTSNDCGAFVVLYHKHMMEDIEQFKVTHCVNFHFDSHHPLLLRGGETKTVWENGSRRAQCWRNDPESLL